MDMHSLEAVEFYTQYHPRWFESVQSYQPGKEYVDVYAKIIPEDWQMSRTGLWYSVYPPAVFLNDQGWKLHISVRTADSIAALKKILPVLRDEVVAFKFLLDTHITSLSNGKIWSRGSSGKFITIYPESMDQFYRLGDRLSYQMRSFCGPYILSDRRWPGSTTVYYRYGGFKSIPVQKLDGTQFHAIQSPTGDQVPDLRTPYWDPPRWAVDPFPSLPKTEQGEKGLDNGRFTITSALSFSNRGGVYKGTDKKTGREVVLKEARPYIELGRNRLDAIEMLEKEYRLLKSLSGSGYFVQAVKMFRAWEHLFLVENYQTGELIGQYMIRQNPLYTKDITRQSLNEYFITMRSLWVQLVEAIAYAHKIGIVLCDLSFTNILVNDGKIYIFDLETSVKQDVDQKVGLYTPGMMKEGVSDKANDYYALGAIIFGSVFLAHGMVGLYRPSLYRFLKTFADDINLPECLMSLISELIEKPEQYVSTPENLIRSLEKISFYDESSMMDEPRLSLPIELRMQKNQLDKTRQSVQQTVQGVVNYLNNTADTSRHDRLFPADLLVFETNPLSIAYGAAGVIYALHRLEGSIQRAFIDWMLQHSMSARQYPPGLFLGSAGIAWVLSELGYMERAIEVMQQARHHNNLLDSVNVMHGVAGYGMACLKLWNDGAGDDFLQEAVRIAHHIDSCCVYHEQGVYWLDENGDISIGYAYGGSGIALFLLYLSLATDDHEIYELGRKAIQFELNQGVWLDGEFAGFPSKIKDPLKTESNASVLSCYWEVGSAGIGTALIRFAEVAPDEELTIWLERLADDATRKYTVFPQLFRGLAGLGNFLIDMWYHTGDRRHLLAAWEVAEGVLLFRMDCEEGVVFPGEQTRRECTDLATGAAGVALFLDRLLNVKNGYQENFLFLVDELLPARKKSGIDE